MYDSIGASIPFICEECSKWPPSTSRNTDSELGLGPDLKVLRLEQASLASERDTTLPPAAVTSISTWALRHRFIIVTNSIRTKWKTSQRKTHYTGKYARVLYTNLVAEIKSPYKATRRFLIKGAMASRLWRGPFRPPLSSPKTSKGSCYEFATRSQPLKTQ